MPMTRDEWLALRRNERPYDDAVEALEYTVIKKHCMRAVKGSLMACVQVQSLYDRKDVIWGHIYQNNAYVLLEGHEIPLRYQVSTRGKRLAKINDLEGQKALLNYLGTEGGEMTLQLMPPRWAISKTRLRSDSFKKLRSASAKKSRANQTRRQYTKPAAIGLRNGIGHA